MFSPTDVPIEVLIHNSFLHNLQTKTVRLAIMVVLYILSVILFLWFVVGFAVNKFCKYFFLSCYEADGVKTIQAICANQQIIRHRVNLIPSRTEHIIEYYFQVESPASASPSWRKKTQRIDAQGCCPGVTPFPRTFPVLVLADHPLSAYPKVWVQRRGTMFLPSALDLFVVCMILLGFGFALRDALEESNGMIDFLVPILITGVLFILPSIVGYSYYQSWRDNVMECAQETGTPAPQNGTSIPQAEFVGFLENKHNRGTTSPKESNGESTMEPDSNSREVVLEIV